VREPISPKGWLVIVGGAATASVILGAWLPIGALLSQSAKASAAQSRLSQLVTQGQQLTAESTRLATPEETARLAREEYQLVAPGQRLIQVLSPLGSAPNSSPGGAYTGDPGLSLPVDPSAAAVAPSMTGTTAPPPTGHAHASSAEGFFDRALGALEFWR
jgi:hypothetical protein